VTSSSPPGPLDAALAALRPSLLAFFARRADRDAAPDLAQETALRVVRLRGAYDAARDAGPWIWRIARTVLWERLRERREGALDDDAPPAAREASAAYQALLRRAHEEAVWGALRAVPDAPRSRLRAFTALHALEGVPHAALEARFGVGPSASKMRVARGLALLEQALVLAPTRRTQERAAALDAAFRAVRAHEEGAARAALLALLGGVDGETRRALGLADAPLDEPALEAARRALVAAGFPDP